VLEGVDGELGGHPLGHGVADDPSAAGVLDRAEVELALAGGVLGDVGQPQLVELVGAEGPFDEVVVNGWAGLAGQAALLRMGRPESLLGAEPADPVPAGYHASVRELVGDEAVAELGVVVVDVDGGVDQVRVGPVPVGHGLGLPLVEGLLGEAEHPAGHRDGDLVGGQVEDQRVHL